MLFSSADIAEYVNAGFEPAWVSVRPVPIVTIDFGNGLKVTRTLHGNIATSVCDTDGKVLDILPGIYQPEEYRKQLEQFVLLYRYGRGVGSRRHSDVLTTEYHKRQLERLKADQRPDRFVYDLRADVGKARIENPVKLFAATDPAPPMQRDPVTGAIMKSDSKQSTESASKQTVGVAGWKELAEDTRINETIRRRQIHEKLAATGPVPMESVVKWLYKEVLHADLDDPMLGLGEVLNKNYPFADEERKPSVP